MTTDMRAALQPFADLFDFYSQTDSVLHCYVDAGRSSKKLTAADFKRAKDALSTPQPDEARLREILADVHEKFGLTTGAESLRAGHHYFNSDIALEAMRRTAAPAPSTGDGFVKARNPH